MTASQTSLPPAPPGEPEGEPTPTPAKPPSLWENRDYFGWWTANTVSVLGTSISNIAFPLLVLFTTGSVAKAGLITAAHLAGTLATTLWGGAMADRFSRKAILVLGPLIQAAALTVVTLSVYSGHSPISLLAGAAAVSGLAAGFTAGATNPALRRIVSKEQLGAATGQEMGRDAAADFLGAPLGGFLFSLARWVPFLADAISFLFAIVGALLIRRPLGPDREDGPKAGVLADIRLGVRFVREQPFLRFVVIWGSLLNVVAQGFTLLFIALVKLRGGGPTAIGLVSSVALFGGIAGAVVAPIVMKSVRPRLVLYVAGWVFVAAFAVTAIVGQPWEIGLVLLVAMFAMVPLNVVLESYLVRIVPDAYSGRVSAVTRFGGQALAWTGPLIAGGLAAAFGVSHGALILAALAVPLAVALHATRALRVLDQPLDQVEEVIPAQPARL